MNINSEHLGTYEVQIEEVWDEDFGDCIRETWKKDSVVHRIGAPAIVSKNIETNEIIQEEWYLHGLLSREDDKPARIFTNDQIKLLEWFVEGKAHRHGKPAILEVTSTGLVSTEEWFDHGKRNRENGAAVIWRDHESGVAYNELWYQQDIKHRIGGAACISRDTNTGIIIEEYWFENGVHSMNSNGTFYTKRHGDTAEILEFKYLRDLTGEVTLGNLPFDSQP
ncbi:MAG: hypothetical protein COC24_002115 [Alphaproteobacteria bacterium]|nr:hypothetical protein [Alphaproteobacteria bacterium]